MPQTAGVDQAEIAKFEAMADDLAEMPETMAEFVTILREILGEMQSIRASLHRIEERLDGE